MTNEKSIKLTPDKEVTTAHSFRVLIKGLGEESPITHELPDGKYLILQTRNEIDNWLPKPVFAFEVDFGNFSIVSITGDRDFATLASEIWHLQFTEKTTIAIRKLKKFKKQLNRIERDLQIRINRRKLKNEFIHKKNL